MKALIYLIGVVCFASLAISCTSNKPIEAVQLYEKLEYDNASSVLERQTGSAAVAQQEKIKTPARTEIPERKFAKVDELASPAEDWALGNEMLKAGKSTDALRLALEIFEKLERSQPLDSKLTMEADAKNAYLFVAKAKLEFKSYRSEGKIILERLIELEPKFEDPYVALANFYAGERSFYLAERILLKALDRLERPSEQSYLLLAKSQKSQNRNLQATQTMQRAKSQYPKSSLTLFWRGMLDFENGQMLFGCRAFYETFEALKDMSASHYNVALCRLREGDTESAEKIIKAAELRFSEEPAFKLLAGVAAQKRGDSVRARRAFKEYILMTGDSALSAKVGEALLRLH